MVRPIGVTHVTLRSSARRTKVRLMNKIILDALASIAVGVALILISMLMFTIVGLPIATASLIAVVIVGVSLVVAFIVAVIVTR